MGLVVINDSPRSYENWLREKLKLEDTRKKSQEKLKQQMNLKEDRKLFGKFWLPHLYN